jgi:hypothetical protein
VLPGKGTVGSVSSMTVDLNHFEKASSTIEELSDIMEFTVSEQYEIVDGDRERDVVRSRLFFFPLWCPSVGSESVTANQALSCCPVSLQPSLPPFSLGVQHPCRGQHQNHLDHQAYLRLSGL